MARTGRVDPDVLLRLRLDGDVRERSAFHRGRLERADLPGGRIRGADDLRRLAPMQAADVRDPADVLLWRPGRRARRERRRYAPRRWHWSGGLAFALSSADVATLAEVGREALELAGIGEHDIVADLLGPDHERVRSQLLEAARSQELQVASVGPGLHRSEVVRLEPSVLVGTAPELLALIGPDGIPRRVHTLVLVGPCRPEDWQRLDGVAARAAPGLEAPVVVRWWSPGGLPATWSQCRAGAAFHVPATDYVEVVDVVTGLPVPDGLPGRVLWTGLGWAATALVRFDAEVVAVAEHGACPDCGREGVRLRGAERDAGIDLVLAGAAAVIDAWAGEVRRGPDRDRLVLWVSFRDGADQEAVAAALRAVAGEVEIRPVPTDEIVRRVEDAKGERLVDRRAVVEDDDR